MSDELTITTSLDQSIPLDASDELASIDQLMDIAVRDRDIEWVLKYCLRVKREMQIRGIALAKVFYLTEKNWEVFGIDDDFYDSFYAYIGLHRNTVVTYIRVWRMLQVAPEDIEERLKEKNIRDLVPIGNAIAQGFELNREDWERLADSSDFNELSKIVREDIKEQKPRKGGLTLMIDRSGDITAWKEDEPYYVGHLEISGGDDAVEKAVERIIKNSGMIRK